MHGCGPSENDPLKIARGWPLGLRPVPRLAAARLAPPFRLSRARGAARAPRSGRVRTWRAAVFPLRVVPARSNRPQCSSERPPPLRRLATPRSPDPRVLFRRAARPWTARCPAGVRTAWSAKSTSSAHGRGRWWVCIGRRFFDGELAAVCKRPALALRAARPASRSLLTASAVLCSCPFRSAFRPGAVVLLEVEHFMVRSFPFLFG